MNKTIIPLAFLQIGQNAVIKEIIGGRCLKRRLKEMGLAKGMIIKILKNDHGPLILALGNSRVALGFGMARKILVEKVEVPKAQ